MHIEITIPFAIAFLSTVFFTPFVRKIMKNADITDKPIVSEHIHKQGTPTTGGLAIILGILFVLSIYHQNKILVLTALLMVVAGIIGLMDDLIGLKIKEFQKVVRNVTSKPVKIGRLTLQPGDEARVATPKAKRELNDLLSQNKVKIIGKVPIKSELEESEKILAQFLIAMFLVASGAFGYTIGGFNLGIFAIPLVIFGIIGAINSVNLIDGMDGLAAGIMGMASIACGIFSISVGKLEASVSFIAIAGACFAFLIYNKIPATIIMGDTGSFALGAGYATAAILGDVIWFAMLAIAVPIISVIISLLHRAGIIKLPVEPLHHTIHYRGLSEGKIVFLYWIITAIICVIALYIYSSLDF